MPQTISPTDFDMSNDDARHLFKRYLAALYPQDVLEDVASHLLIRAGCGAVVYFYMIDKSDDHLVYFAKCETAFMAPLGTVATQVSLWRDKVSATVRGITAKVFDLLIETYGTILSDEQQTEGGRDFWIMRMADAVVSGRRVGLIDMRNKTVEWRLEGEKYRDWIKSHEHAWSPSEAAQNLRFVISKKTL